MNGGEPFFSEAELARSSFEEYAPLDALGRCGAAFALVGPETMPDEPRGSIGMVRPSGWHTVRYDWVDGGYLYNRCHLIGYQLTGENANERNLVTGTRTMNVEGMLPYEDRVAGYVESTGNHVLYRSTPLFEGDDLVARGVLLEGRSVEDGGAAVRFCAWCFNVEPGVEIDYATGESRAAASGEGDSPGQAEAKDAGGAAGSEPSSRQAPAGPETAGEGGEPAGAEHPAEVTYILNARSHLIHKPDCKSVADMAEHNKVYFTGTREEAIEKGYRPCGNCKP